MAFLSIENVCFSYEKTEVIKNFSLDVEEGSFTTLLGASGSGKTTLLRLISGFLEPNSGSIKINNELMNGVLPNKRKIGFVFQDYALFPHLTVEQNLLYGLKIKKSYYLRGDCRVKPCDVCKANSCNNDTNVALVYETAKSLGIENLLARFPSELSGGQQQRVALGRVLVLKPNLLLMDEPLSSLDTNLRIKVREELKEIQQKLKITTLYVTHDQEEAFSLSDKIAVMNEGKLLQCGTPKEIYFSPVNRFTAELTGNANFINGKMIRPEWISIKKSRNNFGMTADSSVVSSASTTNRKNSVVEPVETTALNSDKMVSRTSTTFSGIVTKIEFLGAFTRYKVCLQSEDAENANNEQMITVDQPTVFSEEINVGDKVEVFLRK